MREGVETLATFGDDTPALVRKAGRYYLACWPSRELTDATLKHLFEQAKIAHRPLVDDIRVRRRGAISFAFNFGSQTHAAPAPRDARFLLGSERIAPYDLAAWI